MFYENTASVIYSIKSAELQRTRAIAMHGRVKVRTSEEEKARKEKERQEKLKVFKYAMQKIQFKRKEGQLDQELFDMTGKVLTSNPDIYTLWNIRREIINVFRKTYEKPEELTKLFDDELQMTEFCLKINPKSYCAWHQREWILTTRADPDWKKELDLCTNYLTYDERNFHTWDYRRFVISQSNQPLEEEFKYTTEKIHENFSNYSAWHCRSKLLVALYPDLEGGRPIKDSHHKHELKIVQSAAFTDPDDTSAWFYLRWLLGAVKTDIKLALCAITNSKTTYAFNNYVSKEFVQSSTKLYINGEHVEGDLRSCTGNNYDCVWILDHSIQITDDLDIKVEYAAIEDKIEIIQCKKYKPLTYIGKTDIDFQKKYAAPVIEELKEQLKSCRQLLALEPDSKWTMFTTTVFLYCIDAKLYHKEIITNLQALKGIDKLRAGYYNDLITKWSAEQQLTADYDQVNFSYKPVFAKKMTCLPHLAFYSHCENVDLSNQGLKSQHLKSLIVLQHCKKLSLANNEIISLKDLPPLQLDELNLCGNNLKEDEIQNLNKQIPAVAARSLILHRLQKLTTIEIPISLSQGSVEKHLRIQWPVTHEKIFEKKGIFKLKQKKN